MKKKTVILGVSILTGVISSLFLRKERKDKQNNERRQQFIGQWVYTTNTKEIVELVISPEYTLIVNGNFQPVTLVELSPQKLVLLDSFGYHLLFSQENNELFFYDEAEDRRYLLTKVTGTSSLLLH